MADSPRAMLALRCLATGRMGVERAADGCGVGFEVAEVVDDAGVVLDGGRLPAGDDGEVEVVGDAGVLEVVLPGVVALFAEGIEEMFGAGRRCGTSICRGSCRRRRESPCGR